MNSRHLLTYEHKSLRLMPHGSLPREAYEAFLEHLPLMPTHALTPTHDGLRTGSYCGLVQCQDWTLEILPKVYGTQHDQPARGLLTRMLGACFDIPVWQHGLADAEVADDLLQVVVSAFFKEALQQLRQGWVKSYVDTTESLTRPRGTIRISEQVRRGRASAHQIHCAFDELTENNPHNQAIKAALLAARNWLGVGSRLNTQADQLLFALADVEPVTLSGDEIRNLTLNRIMQRYARLLMLSSWLVDLLGPDVHNGQRQGLSLLFDMNTLFQDYLAAAMHEAIRKHPLRERLKLTQERPTRYLLKNQDGEPLFLMKPDLCLSLDGQLVAILDAKWKLLKLAELDRKSAVSQADLYQLLAYGHSYSCKRLALVYPHHIDVQNWQARHFNFAPHDNTAMAISLQVFNLDEPQSSAEVLLKWALEAQHTS